VKYSSRDGYEELLANGMEIYEFQPTMMHVKAMVVDGLLSIAGSANFDNRSFELNDELSVAVADAQLAAELTRDFEQDLTRSQRLTLEEWKQRGFMVKMREKFWGFFGEVF
jgi:cardiolipin synthase